MKYLRNFLSIPVAATLGIIAPGIYLYIAIKFEEFNCWLSNVFWLMPNTCAFEGYILFFIPSAQFWLWVQLIFSGFASGFTTLYVALKIAVDEDNLLYYSLFMTSLSINLFAIYFNAQKELIVAIPTILSNLIAFSLAGAWPLYLALKNKKLSDQV